MQSKKDKLVLCLTGNIGTGKSTALAIFAGLGAITISSDKIVSDILDGNMEIREKMKNLFGNEVVNESGKIDRHKVSEKVFSDSILLDKLNSILHPLVYDTVEKLVQQSSGVIVWEIPLLFETSSEKKCDYTLTLVTNEDTSFSRIQSRGLDRKKYLAIKSRQMDPMQQKSLSDFVIYNDNTTKELEDACKEIFQDLQIKLKG